MSSLDVENQDQLNFSEAFEKKVQISLKTPILCTITKIVKFNAEKEFITIVIEDINKQQILAFVYGVLAQFLNVPVVKTSLLPISITVFKGQFKELKKDTFYLEIHQAILDNQTYINSNWIGSHEYCSMQTFLKISINTGNVPNENLLWGNLFHDYLSNIFSQKNLENLAKHRPSLKLAVKSAFIVAIFQNWRLLVALRNDYETLLDEFECNFLEDEVRFIIQEIEKYRNEYGKFAGLRRNEIMAKEAEVVCAFWDGSSKGTKHMIETSLTLKKSVCIFIHTDDEDEIAGPPRKIEL